MQVLVKGKQVQVGDALRKHVKDRLRAAVSKYFGDAMEAQVVFSREGRGFETAISVHAIAGVTPQSHARNNDIYASFDAAAERVEKQLRRYKRRLRNHHQGSGAPTSQLTAHLYTLAEEAHDREDDEPETLAPVIVAETTTAIESLTVGEAVMHMNLTDLPALMFRNSAHGGLNMVYQRRDSSIGWIDPQAPTATP